MNTCPCGNEVCAHCGLAPIKCRCSLRPGPKPCPHAPERAFIAPCSDCDPCIPRKSLVKICSYVVPTLEEGRVFKDSFVFNQTDDTVYYITDDGTDIPFGSRPMIIDGFNPETRKVPRQMVFDFTNNAGYIFNAEGEYRIIRLEDPNQPAPIAE